MFRKRKLKYKIIDVDTGNVIHYSYSKKLCHEWIKNYHKGSIHFRFEKLKKGEIKFPGFE